MIHIHQVVFKTALGHLSVPLDRTTEVFTLAQTTSVPWAPAWLTGLIRRQGRIITIVDLMSFLKLPNADGPTMATLIEHKSLTLALAAPHIEVVDTQNAEIIEGPRTFLPQSPLISRSLRTPKIELHELDLDQTVTAILESI